MTADRAGAAERPTLALLLLAFNQQASVGEAVAGALAQDYSPLTLVLSDDASDDATFEAMRRAVAGYAGPHRIVLNRNPHNLGIGAHLSRLVGLCDAELLLVAAGDDVSLPQRARRTAEAWLASGRRIDLIAAALEDIDADGRSHGVIRPSDLSRYRDLADWLADPPHVVGAAQAWTRRLWERFGPLPAGVFGEDQIMVLRAIGSGGAVTLDEPLVRYRRGGVSRRVRNLSAHDVVERLLKNNRHALVELPLMLCDARTIGQLGSVEAALNRRLARERYIERLFGAGSARERLRLVQAAREVPLPARLRLALYAGWPGLLAPWFWLKRRLAG
jgi:glycosyltransferase involved in cell wall biosynthesis